MEISLLIRCRLEKIGREQRDLARAAQVTESYISQLLTRGKAHPAPERTDLYDRMGKVLKFPRGELARQIECLRKLRFKGKRPTPLYYYRELQDLRDPLHFAPPVPRQTAASRS